MLLCRFLAEPDGPAEPSILFEELLAIIVCRKGEPFLLLEEGDGLLRSISMIANSVTFFILVERRKKVDAFWL